MSNMIEVAKTGDILPGGLVAVKEEEIDLVIGNVEGTFYAVSRSCSHMFASLERGTLQGYILTCPLHQMQYDIRSGKALSGPVANEGGSIIDIESTCLESFRVVLEDGIVKVEI